MGNPLTALSRVSWRSCVQNKSAITVYIYKMKNTIISTALLKNQSEVWHILHAYEEGCVHLTSVNHPAQKCRMGRHIHPSSYKPQMVTGIYGWCILNLYQSEYKAAQGLLQNYSAYELTHPWGANNDSARQDVQRPFKPLILHHSIHKPITCYSSR